VTKDRPAHRLRGGYRNRLLGGLSPFGVALWVVIPSGQVRCTESRRLRRGRLRL